MAYKIGIIGPESTAKSTLSQQLAQAFHGEYIAEYARTYIEQLPHPYTYQDVENIARHQIEELNQPTHHTYQFYDTELIITKVWFLHKYQQCPDFLIKTLANNPIDFYLLCAPDLPFEPDPLRENPHLRTYLFDWYEHELQAQQKPYAIIQGIGSSRFHTAHQAIEQFCHPHTL